MQVAHVVLPLPIDKPYSYLVPPELEALAQVGSRVLVPFGPRKLTGFVVHREPAGDSRKLKPLLDVLDDLPAFTPDMLKLTRWMASYYLCSWGEVLKAALPAGIEVESRRRVFRTDQPLNGWSGPEAAREVVAFLDDVRSATVAEVQRAAGDDIGLGQLRKLEAEGLVRIEQELVPPKVRVKTERHVRLTSTPDPADVRGEKQRAVLAFLTERPDRSASAAQVGAATGASSSTLKSLEKKGWVEVFDVEVVRTPLGDLPRDEPPPALELSDEQQHAMDAIRSAIENDTFHTFLLHGVTGSGKTEVYLRALRQVLAKEQTAIVLVPEIALTPQTVRRFRAHFGDQVAVLHSRMSPGERFDAWRKLRAGEFPIVIGPRSAILAPLENVGLIVVDEEHEASYKQFDPAPRYHARDVAVMRAHLNGAVCLLGSATPSLESYLNARSEKYTWLRMTQRVPGADGKPLRLPPVRVVDLTLEKKKHRLDGALSLPLRDAMQKRLDLGEQIILLQNRRGYSPIATCDHCGWTPECRDCAVSLTFHKTRRHLRCHYCGRAERLPRVCPKCNEPEITLLGTGTQRVEEDVAAAFPQARLIRMDLDTTSKKGAHRKLLDAFGRGEADILLGTQMVAKGLDFPNVTLVGVINADTGMLLPDFRSSERAFQLLTQVAGRAGRAGRGEVFLQTRNPKHIAVRYAVAHDYLGFVEAEMPDRAGFHYPPFGKMIGVEFKGPNERAVEQTAKGWTAALRQAVKQSLPPGNPVQILGPEAAFVGRIKKQYRYHTLVKVPRLKDAPDLHALAQQANAAFGKPPKFTRIAIDVDPVGLF